MIALAQELAHKSALLQTKDHDLDAAQQDRARLQESVKEASEPSPAFGSAVCVCVCV